jgi:hypothetical protein
MAAELSRPALKLAHTRPVTAFVSLREMLILAPSEPYAVGYPLGVAVSAAIFVFFVFYLAFAYLLFSPLFDYIILRVSSAAVLALQHDAPSDARRRSISACMLRHAPIQPRDEKRSRRLLRLSESLIEQREQLTEAIRGAAGGRRIQPLQRLAEPRMRACAVNDVIGLDWDITCDCF